MATQFSATVVSQIDTDARFQAFCVFVDATIRGGWTQTTDTGQFTPSSAAHPTTTNQKVGYRVYKMADTLQSTAPVFMRVDYGSRDAASKPNLFFNIGSGSDGAGNITGAFVAEFITSLSSQSTTTNNCYGSASTNRVQLALFTATSSCMGFSLERTKDSTGADTADGLLVLRHDGTSTASLFTHSRVISLSGTSAPEESGMNVVLANRTPSAFGADVGIGLPVFFKGIAVQPGIGVIVTNQGDFTDDAVPTLAVYGTTHTYHLGGSSGTSIKVATGNAASSDRSNTRTGIIYE